MGKRTAIGCSVEACSEPHKAKGYCEQHYWRWRRSGDPLVGRPRWSMENGCSVDGCEKRPLGGRGLCHMHRWRQRKYDSLDVPPRRVPGREQACTVAGCRLLQTARGYCATHWRRWRKHGDPTVVNPRPEAAAVLVKHGYRKLRSPEHPNADSSGRVWEHRAVMSQMLGRPLLTGETVHHRNGDRADNRPANLELWVTPPRQGQRPADLVAWAQEILRRYVAYVDREASHGAF